MLMRKIIALIAVLAAGAAAAQAYRWVDENGVVHYSDRPREGAERIILPQQNQRPQPRTAPQGQAGANTGQADAEGEASEEPEFFYESIEVASPAPEETLWNIEGVLNVSLRTQPALRQGHQVRVYFDGQPQTVTGSSFQINEVYRGVHNIQVEILDENGRLMGRSLPNRFYVQQNSIVRN